VKLVADTEGFASAIQATSINREEAALAVHARLGGQAAAHIAGYVEGSNGANSGDARWLFSQVLPDLARRFYDTPGFSGGIEVGFPLGARLAAALATDYDLTTGTQLGARGSLAYQHICRCLAVTLWSSTRLARRGTDAWLTVDLMP
jgi:hypothetical protein